MVKTLARHALCGLVAVGVLSGLASCAAHVTNVWKDPGYGAGPFRQVAVFVLAADPTISRLVEDAFVQRLPSSTRGAAGHGLVPGAEQGDVDKVRARLRTGDFDGAIVVHLIRADKSGIWAPDAFQRTPVPRRPLGQHYADTYQEVQRAGFVTSDMTVRLQTLVYSVASEAPIWSGASRTFAPTAAREVTEGVAEAVIEQLQKAGILAEL